MNGCELLSLLIKLIDYNGHTRFAFPNRIRKYNRNEVLIVTAGANLHGLLHEIEMRESLKSKLEIHEIKLKTKELQIKDLNPWYINAAEKGGSKKRKPFIK